MSWHRYPEETPVYRETVIVLLKSSRQRLAARLTKTGPGARHENWVQGANNSIARAEVAAWADIPKTPQWATDRLTPERTYDPLPSEIE